MKKPEPGSEEPPPIETSKNNILYPKLSLLLRYAPFLVQNLKAASKQFLKILFLKWGSLILAQQSTAERRPPPTPIFKNIVSN